LSFSLIQRCFHLDSLILVAGKLDDKLARSLRCRRPPITQKPPGVDDTSFFQCPEKPSGRRKRAIFPICPDIMKHLFKVIQNIQIIMKRGMSVSPLSNLKIQSSMPPLSTETGKSRKYRGNNSASLDP